MPDNQNPAAVGAAGGASESTCPGRTAGSLANITVVVEIVDAHGRFRASVDGRIVLASSWPPFVDTARVLISEGHDPHTILEMRHAGTDHVSLRGPLWAAARLDVKDAKFVRHRPRRCALAKADASLAHALERSRHV
jgi:hypothetical protein